MYAVNQLQKQTWVKPQVVVIDLTEYEAIIEANARSGASGCGCMWEVGCRVFL